MGMSLSKLREFVMDREGWHAVIHGGGKSRMRLSDWTELIDSFKLPQPNTSGETKDKILIIFFSCEHKNWVTGRGEGEFYFVPFANIKGKM